MTSPRPILVTGGAGYIGSHTVLQLLEAGQRVVVVDNLCNAHEESLRRVAELSGQQPTFHQVDLLDAAALGAVIQQHRPQAAIHFAGLKAVGESSQIPIQYYHNNITGTIHLLQALAAVNCRQLVFSSSATVYGDAQEMPITEAAPLSATNAYGRTKLFIEHLLADACIADPEMKVICLRYFNPVGAHPSGRIGEDPNGIPNNLMPFITQVAVGRRPHLNIFGNDYPTPDGTGVRDYIHVVDLAAGHLAALDAMDRISGCEAINLGTGRGYSVLEVLRAMETASGRPVPYEIQGRRRGDVATSYADPSKAQQLLGWQARRELSEMCDDAWRWQQSNPLGYAGQP
ncbi:MAG: UDP-glucose 4-epimerase GalE [Planctomycetota bacterium]|nr:MAG: UDP-glucose 4-epimerase GalE [Planctomycetota bacterium]